MKKFHINPDTGTVSLCRAENGQCPFGGASGTENHYESIKDAKQAYEKKMSPKTFVKHTKKDKQVVAKAEIEQAQPSLPGMGLFENQDDEVSESMIKFGAREDAKKTWKNLDGKIKGIVKKSPNFKKSAYWMNLVQDRRKAFYAFLVADKDHFETLTKAEQEPILAEQEAVKAKDAAKFEEWKARQNEENGAFEYHPEITPALEQPAKSVISAFSGMTDDEIDKKVKENMDSGMTMTEAYRKVWAEAPLRTDKKIVSIDLEVAAPMVANRVDQGPYSSIIEVGYIVRHPDGRIEKKSYLCDVPEDLKKTVGTGAEDIHNISLDMIAGNKVFCDDQTLQKELMEDLRGSVMIAHNAKYEMGQLSHSLQGFNKALAENDIEVLDTKQVCRLYLPSALTNSNKDFVEATGGKYEGAHRAFEDAMMSVNALFRLKQLDEIE